MSTIQLKSANLPTSVPRAKIRLAVEEAFKHYGFFQTSRVTIKRPVKKAVKKK
jgi:hypothetical protein